jgi:hypothetical protein
MKDLVPMERIENRILQVRGKKIMLDSDIAKLYEVPTKVLNQAVKRNIKRFPEDFMFRLTTKEKEELVTNCDHLKPLKFSSQMPYAFTEQGVAMLSSVLNSERAIMVNIQIMRAFVSLKREILTYTALKRKIESMEKKYDVHFKVVFDTIRRLMAPPSDEKKPRIGFHKE